MKDYQSKSAHLASYTFSYYSRVCVRVAVYMCSIEHVEATLRLKENIGKVMALKHTEVIQRSWKNKKRKKEEEEGYCTKLH